MQLPLFTQSHPTDESALTRCLQADVVAVDIETETRYPGWGPRHDFGLSYPAPITMIALTWQGEATVLVAPFEDFVAPFLVKLFSSNATIVAHNAVFDLRGLSKLTDGLVPNYVWDTLSMAWLLHPQLNGRYNLISTAEMLDINVPPHLIEMKAQRAKLHTIPLAEAMAYAQADAELTYAIYQAQQPYVASMPELADWEMRASRAYAKLAAQGIHLDFDYIEKLQTELERIKEDTSERLRADGLEQPDSPKARAHYLYHTKRVPLPEFNRDNRMFFTRAGWRRLRDAAVPRVHIEDLSTGRWAIGAYIEDGSPYAKQLRDLSTYAQADWQLSLLSSLVEHAALDGKVHTLLSSVTDTGRRASSYPAMQNWKMPDMAGVATAEEGFTLVEIDYAHAESVMSALISGDDNLAIACQTPDFHSAMAEQYFGERWLQADDQGRKHLRGMAKRITFGTAYGMGARSLAKSLDITVEEAQALLNAKEHVFSQEAYAKRKAREKVQNKGELKLWTGRPIKTDTPFVAWNYICQGGVSEMVKRSLVMISEAYEARNMRSRVVLDIHDALIIEVAHDEWDEALAIASHAMQTVIPDELRCRTTPPVVFRASPDLEENQHKWGKGQWHPTLPTRHQ